MELVQKPMPKQYSPRSLAASVFHIRSGQFQLITTQFYRNWKSAGVSASGASQPANLIPTNQPAWQSECILLCPHYSRLQISDQRPHSQRTAPRALIIYEIFCGQPGVDACTGCSDRRTWAADQWWPRHRLLCHSAHLQSDAPTCFNFKHKCLAECASLQ